MNSTSNIGAVFEVPGSPYGRFAPEPRAAAGNIFRSVLNGAVSAVTGGGMPGISAEYVDLLNRQIEVQQQMQAVSLYSNIEKSKHEIQMSPVRNIRVG